NHLKIAPMRNSSLYAFMLMVLIGGTSCQKDEPLWIRSGTTKALLNGEPWQADNHAAYSDNFDRYGVQTYLRNSEGYVRQSLSLWGIQPRVTEYFPLSELLDPNETYVNYVTLLGDGDAICDQFVLNDNFSNRFDVLEFDTISKRISGTFTLEFLKLEVAHELGCSTAAPDTVRFTEGTFETVVVR
ncbi:MAG: hypothetical protein WBA17_09990, partial [Saprospiraceae bacterium]